MVLYSDGCRGPHGPGFHDHRPDGRPGKRGALRRHSPLRGAAPTTRLDLPVHWAPLPGLNASTRLLEKISRWWFPFHFIFSVQAYLRAGADALFPEGADPLSLIPQSSRDVCCARAWSGSIWLTPHLIGFSVCLFLCSAHRPEAISGHLGGAAWGTHISECTGGALAYVLCAHVPTRLHHPADDTQFTFVREISPAPRRKHKLPPYPLPLSVDSDRR